MFERRNPLSKAFLRKSTSFAVPYGTATMIIQQSNEYIQQIEAETERPQQLRDQVMVVIQSEEQPETEAPARKRAAKKTAGTKTSSKKTAAKSELDFGGTTNGSFRCSGAAVDGAAVCGVLTVSTVEQGAAAVEGKTISRSAPKKAPAVLLSEYSLRVGTL